MSTNLAASLSGRRFATISCDPPWQYKGFAGVGIPARVQHYQTLSFEQLCSMPVRLVAKRDCLLAMWVISSHVDQAVAVAKAWGFGFTTILFWWDKGQMSFGKWTRQEGELCLGFSRGDPKPLGTHTGVRQTIREKRSRVHSRKPQDALARLELIHGGPYLEMFSRSTREGWTAWGNEADLFGLRGPQAPE